MTGHRPAGEELGDKINVVAICSVSSKGGRRHCQHTIGDVTQIQVDAVLPEAALILANDRPHLPPKTEPLRRAQLHHEAQDSQTYGCARDRTEGGRHVRCPNLGLAGP